MKSQFVNFLDIEVAKHRSSFADFQPYADTRVETFFYEHVNGKTDYSKLWQVMRTILLLSHGQATVERGFSVNKQVCSAIALSENFCRNLGQ